MAGGREARTYRDHPAALVPIDYNHGAFSRHYWYNNRVWVLVRQKLAETLGMTNTTELLAQFDGQHTSLLCVSPRTTTPQPDDNVHRQTVLPINVLIEWCKENHQDDLVVHLADARQHVLDKIAGRHRPERPKPGMNELRSQLAELKAKLAEMSIYKDWYDTIRSISAVKDPVARQRKLDALVEMARQEG